MLVAQCDLKRIRHRVAESIQARLAFVSAMFNVLLDLFRPLHPDADPFRMTTSAYGTSATRETA